MLMLNVNAKEINTTKLYVSNLPLDSDEHTLTQFFSQFGRVLQCSLLFRSTKYAFVQYESVHDVENVFRNVNKMFLMGQRLNIRLSRANTRNDLTYLNDLPYNNRKTETKLYVSNLPEKCSEKELRILFEKYSNNVIGCELMWKQNAFVRYNNYNDASLALANLNGYLYNGKHLSVELSRKKTFKSKSKEIKQESSILCYRASDLEVTKQPTDWIKLIENGSLPVVSDLNSEESSERVLALSEIPTPECPDFFAVKIPNIYKKPVSPKLEQTRGPFKNESDLLKQLIKKINDNSLEQATETNQVKLNYLLFPETKNESYGSDYENTLLSLVKKACYC